MFTWTYLIDSFIYSTVATAILEPLGVPGLDIDLHLWILEPNYNINDTQSTSRQYQFRSDRPSAHK